MCIICRTPNVQELVGFRYLNCHNCPLLTAIPKELVGLTNLNCGNCPLLTAIPKELVGLTELFCANCPLLTAIPMELVNLATLYCYNCPLLHAIPKGLVRLTMMDCSNCPLLTAIPKDLFMLQWLYCSGCPWLPLNAAKFPTHLPSAHLVQRRWRCSPLRRFLKLTRSRAFCEHFYSPEQMGGRWAKLELGAFASGLAAAAARKLGSN
jgi:hypothetical protein